jgi:TatD DNase family protein
MRLVDSHAHVHDPAFAADREAVLQAAREAGVERIVCVGATDGMEGARAAVKLAEAHSDVFATVGVHPHDVGRMTDGDWEELRALCDHPRVVAVGETGLDFYYDHSPRGAQRDAFHRFARLAREVHKPLVVHVRDAHADAAQVLESERAGEAGAQVHCFTGGAAEAERYLALGLQVSFAGIVTFRNADALREAARRVPLSRLLVETDCPYLAPVPKRGKRNEPAFVRYVVECIAQVKGLTPEEVAQATAENARAFFRMP